MQRSWFRGTSRTVSREWVVGPERRVLYGTLSAVMVAVPLVAFSLIVHLSLHQDWLRALFFGVIGTVAINIYWRTRST